MMKIYVGTSGYAYKEWKGKFYPEKISPKEMLRFYSERLAAVEINNTFYRMPKESVLVSWARTGSGRFRLRAQSAPGHNASEAVERCVRGDRVPLQDAVGSGQEAGAGPLSVSQEFSCRPVRAGRFSRTDSPRYGLAHSNSAAHPGSMTKFWTSFVKRDASLCIADSDENPVHEIIPTASWGYLRLRRSDYTDADLSQWMERILSQKWERAFVFFKHEDEAGGAEMAMRFQELIDSRMKKINPFDSPV